MGERARGGGGLNSHYQIFFPPISINNNPSPSPQFMNFLLKVNPLFYYRRPNK